MYGCEDSTSLTQKSRTRHASLALCAVLAGWVTVTRADEPLVPADMRAQLATVTADMAQKIASACPAKPIATPTKARRILIFSRCAEFTHESISVAEKALSQLGTKTGAWSTDVSYDYEIFDAAKLAAYDAIVLNNSQHMKIPAGAARTALLDFVRGGKGLVAFHSAVDGWEDFPEMKQVLGGAGAGHPWGHYRAWRFKVEEPNHPITASLDAGGFSFKDEIYQYDQNNTSRRNLRVLVSVDMNDPETAKDDKGQRRGFRTDGLNPVVWIRREGSGRVFVSGFGHNGETFWDARMLNLFLAGIQYAMGDLKADDALVAERPAVTPPPAPTKSVEPANVSGSGLLAQWWNNNSFSGDPALSSRVTTCNPILDGPAAPFPAATPPLGPEFVSARFTGTFVPNVSGEYKFVANADDYVALWIDGVEEIAWSGHTASDRFSAHTIKLVKDTPLKIRVDYRQDKLGYKLLLRLAHHPGGAQIDLDPAVGAWRAADIP